MRRSLAVFVLGSAAGLGALGFNFLLRLGSVAPFPPESALSAFLGVVPASIEEPMVQSFGELAGQIGLVIATVVAAVVYGAMTVVFDRYGVRRLSSQVSGKFEVLLILALVPWLLFGVVLFPIGGDAVFGVASPYADPKTAWVFPLGLLLVQGVFALALSLRYRFPQAALPTVQGRVTNGVGRREFIEKAGIGALALAGAVLGLTSIGSLISPGPSPSGGGTPVDLAAAPEIFNDPRLASFVGTEATTNSDFYRVAVDIVDPHVDSSSWSLAVDGMVDSPKNFSLQDIQSFPRVDQFTTFECVSNNVNGNLISNAEWGGVKISDILASAGGVQPGAEYVVFRSVDGYSVGIQLSKAMMPDSLLAYAMNGVQLPIKHGYPLRGVIPGLYGMMSAKWINKISVVGSVYEGYWQSRGWTNDATIFTETFITLPSSGSVSLSQSGGSIIIAGYAFAGDRGVSKVEVSLDNGSTWEEAQLKPPLSNLTWALWAYEWKSPSLGEHNVIARATDGTGAVQTSAKAGTFPNGATGYAAAIFMVTD